MELPKNVWDNADCVAMAVRLRYAGKCPQQVDDMLGMVVRDIVKMAVKLYPRERIIRNKRPMNTWEVSIAFSEDTEMELVYYVMRSIYKGKAKTKNPRSLINFFVKTAQNRLDNIIRNASNRERLTHVVSGEESDYVMNIISTDIMGKLITAQGGPNGT